MPKSSLVLDSQNLFNLNSSNESIVTTCSTGLKADDISCFTNSACYPENPITRATGQLQWHDFSSLPFYSQNISNLRWGTAFFISPNLIMTAGHCFDVSTNMKEYYTPKIGNYVLSSEELAPFMKLNMGYAYQQCAPGKNDIPEKNETSFTIKKLIEHRIGGLDYAIAELDGTPGNIYGFLPFDFCFMAGQIMIPQHPAGGPKKIETGHGVAYGENEKRMINYDKINTLGGSSGAPLSPNMLSVCGIHIQGTSLLKPSNTAIHLYAVLQKSPLVGAFFHQQHPTILKNPSPPSSESSSYWLLAVGLIAVIGGLTAYTQAEKNISKSGGAFIAILGFCFVILHFLTPPNTDASQNKPGIAYQPPKFSC